MRADPYGMLILGLKKTEDTPSEDGVTAAEIRPAEEGIEAAAERA